MRTFRTAKTPIVNSILWLTAIHMTAAALSFVIWRITNRNLWVDLFFKYQGSLFLTACTAAELWLAWRVFRQFTEGEPMRAAWLFIAISSFHRLTGSIFSFVLSADSYLNPVFVASGPLNASFSSACRHFGMFVGGPLHMAFLAVGLFLVLRTLRRHGMLSRLRLFDLFLVAVVAAFTLRQTYEIIDWLRKTPAPYDLFKALGWATDPLLSILLFEAILIRRSAIETGLGLLPKSWAAFATGILLTSLGDIGLWATAHDYLPWPYSSVTWYVWFLASAAFTLGPAYQAEASRRALAEA